MSNIEKWIEPIRDKTPMTNYRFHVCSVHIDDLVTHETDSVVWCDSYVPPGNLRNELWWLPGLNPNRELQEWFSHHPELWYEFRRRYRCQLISQVSLCEQLRSLACQGLLILVYQSGSANQNLATVIEDQLIHLECQHRWSAGLMIGGHTFPVRSEIIALGGLWYTKHKTWMMPDKQSWRYIVDLLPGDF
ncbi:DUF488 family protein [Gimesia benthica]|uniref:DUF488 family protein n=1 Tax=Gimesia benthica TaxID=2608982 RepID=A0A6I6ALA4_9PLAN|nr:DUF488 family protein [Gimesia benthica]QGQ25780.1 DUF488 family protein [Gimesia benthica]